MSGIIHFSSGKTLEIEETEFQNMPIVLNSKGIKTKKTKAGHLIPMNSMTMEYVEHVPEVAGQVIDTEPKLPHNPITTNTVPNIPEQKEQVKQPKPKTNDEMLAEIMQKSNCKHEPEKLELYIQHTAKGIRYFPRCSSCGKRERYVSEKKILEGTYAGTPNEKWTKEDLAHAKPWIED
jgi:hypothetical protein